MNINELDSYNLDDAVKFNNRLNPVLWDEREQLKPRVHDALLKIADDFKEFLGVSDLQIKDVTISGSNAAFTYTPHSDIDLHLVVDIPELNDDVYRELFNAKKYQYNDEHDITIGGYDVELYVQDSNDPVVSQGEYSVLNNTWIQVPRRVKSDVDDLSTKAKYEDLKSRINNAIDSGDHEKMYSLWDKIRKMRKTGLDQHGEFGPENLAFKMLRTQGEMQRLRDSMNSARDLELSLNERTRTKKKVKYGYGGYWYPGFDYFTNTAGAEDSAEGVNEDVTSTPDGVGPSTRMFLSEEPKELKNLIREFAIFAKKELKLKQIPKIKIIRDPEWSKKFKTFGRYDEKENQLSLATANRHPMDVLRTLAHELAHRRQDERGQIDVDSGMTGSPEENQAHAVAGVLMRHFAELHPEYFEEPPIDEGVQQYPGFELSVDRGHYPNIKENASGYIPTKKQAKDPRYSMALTVDIHPGEVQRQAAKMGFSTDSVGIPPLLRADGKSSLTKKLQSALREYKETGTVKEWDRYGNQDPTGPERPVEYPKGTVKVDVSDTYDWYRLGQDISDLDRADPKDYAKGPPMTVLAFGSEPIEHKYMKGLKRLGLPTQDLDEPGEEDLDESLLVTDVPNEDWLEGKREYAKSRGRDSFGVPYMGSTTAYVRQPSYVELPVDVLARIPGARGEQSNVRYDDLKAIMKIMQDTGKLPLDRNGKEYMPFITVAWNGEPWVSEGNHRIMAAKRLGWKTLPVELKYFDGGERIRSGVLYPGKIGLGDVKNSHETDENPLVVVYDKDGELHTHANLSVANNIFRTNVKPDDVFKGPVKVKSGGSYGEVTFALSKHHKSGPLVTTNVDEDWRSALATGISAAAMSMGGVPKSTPVPTPTAQVQQVKKAEPARAQTPKDLLINTAKSAGISGNELVQLVAQAAHETLDFTRMHEKGTPEYFRKKYESPRKARILGNKRKGDGERFKGRGFIQLTGRDNYTRAGQALGLDLVNHPELAADPANAARIAIWYWKSRVAPKVADFTNTKAVTKKINPGMKHQARRQEQFKKYQVAMNEGTSQS